MMATVIESLEGRTWLASALVAVQVLGVPGFALAQGDALSDSAQDEVVAAVEAETEAEMEAAAEAELEDTVATAEEIEPVVSETTEEEDATEVDFYQVGATTLDVVVLRPLGGLTLLGGIAFFVASAPFVAPSEGIGATWDIFVYSSYDYAVLRPIGELF